MPLLSRSLALAFAVALAACDLGGPSLADLNVSDLSHDADALVGTWDLVSTTSAGMTGPPTTVPAPAGLQSYVFAADGRAEVYREGVLSDATAWRLEPPGPTYPDAPPSLVVGERRLYFGIDGDRFYVDHRPADGPLYEYARR